VTKVMGLADCRVEHTRQTLSWPTSIALEPIWWSDRAPSYTKFVRRSSKAPNAKSRFCAKTATDCQFTGEQFKGEHRWGSDPEVRCPAVFRGVDTDEQRARRRNR
jgi:hypothetical protein